MEVRYRNDLYGNYMLIEIPETADTNQYSFKMLEKNKIPGILPCKERMEDGKGYWYVDISRKRSLAQEYQDQEMQLEDMIVIFQQLISIMEELRTFLLSEAMVILDPEYLFRDMENNSLYLLILPWNAGEKTVHKFAEFFLEKINHRDENGVNAAYLFYRQQNQPNFSLYHFLPVLEKESILKRQKRKEETEWKEYENREEGPKEIQDNFLEEPLLDEVKKENAPKTFFAFLKSLLFKRKQNDAAQENTKKEEFPEWEMDVGMKETVFFDSYGSDEYLKLQWKEKGRKKQFILREFPCTVGKIQEEVELRISDLSVSRIHCRFVEKDKKICLMDLNSTNGTFLNGLALKGGEILEIEKNDEILIGKVKVNVV